MDQRRSSSKITEIVRLQQMLKKWKKLAVGSKSNAGGRKGMGFLKRTLSFSDDSGGGGSSSVSCGVPKGFLAVSVGEEMKRFVIPTEYLGHRAFAVLLSEAEEEFGFQQEGVLRIPCEVSVFERILKVVGKNKEGGICFCSSEADMAQPADYNYYYSCYNLPPKPIYR
ncbi:Auxin-induced protein 6B [Apostasia shenzhenica]|uniref:Auxin-induced protein 6B n=1 Tax=Apostasia shenzhenica TaxID=1088818 RepID=A0A2I0A5K6_9ASPA|nr:Auxin-induced protein 6B [Apostasia shenzhenica]